MITKTDVPGIHTYYLTRVMETDNLYNKTLTKMSGLTEQEVDVSIDKKDTSIDEGLERIIKSPDLDVCKSEGSSKKVLFEVKKTSNVLAELRFTTFNKTDILYLGWLEVRDPIRGEDISRQLRREFIDNFGHRYNIYTDINSTRLISVAIDQGFRQIENGDLEGIYVRPKS